MISVGHSHPYLVKCMSEQLQQLMFYSNSVINKLQERLANELGELSGYPDYRAFFVNSGAEANENAETGFVSYGEKTGSGFQKLFSWAYVGGCGSDGQSCLHAPINTNHNVYLQTWI